MGSIWKISVVTSAHIFLLIFFLIIINNFIFKHVYFITLYSGVTKFVYVSLVTQMRVCVLVSA
jgi:hypothetical protein